MRGAAPVLNSPLPIPHRVDVADSQIDLLRFLREASRVGDVALAILTEIRGGAARSLGAMVAVAQDGGYCGYVSGGCVEAAVAAEALLAMQEGRDRQVLYGDGSEFFDIVLPCGGGLTIAIHVLREFKAVDEALSLLAQRQAASLIYDPLKEMLTVSTELHQTGWHADCGFLLALKPNLLLAISGDGLEAKALSRLAEAAGYEVANLDHLQELDPYSAAIFLRHDIDAELNMLAAALRSKACYIGALGSRKTHQKRLDRLKAIGFTDQELERIHAPIGLFGPTRHSSALALSILAQIAALEGTRW